MQFYGKTMEKVRNRLKTKFIENDEEKINKRHSNWAFNGIHKSYTK